MLKHYVEFLLPGSFFPESIVREVADRTRPPIDTPKNCFGYTFFSRTEVELDGEILRGQIKDRSPRTYFGKVMTLEEVKAMPGDNRILISNVSQYPRGAVKTVCGNWQPLEEGDVVIQAEVPV